MQTWRTLTDQCRRSIWQDSTDAPSWDKKITKDIGEEAIRDLGTITKAGFTDECPVDEALAVEAGAIWASTFETRGADRPTSIDRSNPSGVRVCAALNTTVRQGPEDLL